MWAEAWRGGLVVAVLGLAAGAARAEPIGFAFTAEDPSGCTLTGRFGYDDDAIPSSTQVAPGISALGEFFFGPLDHRSFAVVEHEGRRFDSRGGTPRRTDELSVIDGLGQSPAASDRFTGSFSLGFGIGPALHIELVDREGAAFETHTRLPASLDLDRFEGRHVFFNPGPGPGGFNGTITSLTRVAIVVPEPPTSALWGSAALLGMAGWRWRRRRKAA